MPTTSDMKILSIKTATVGTEPPCSEQSLRPPGVVAAEQADAALAAMKANPYGKDAAIIGEVVATPEDRGPRVSLRTPIGSLRIMDVLVGEQLPRIC